MNIYRDLEKYLVISLISGKRGKEDTSEVQIQWETRTVSTGYFDLFYKEILVELAVYKGTWLTRKSGIEEVQKLANRLILTE